MCLSKTNIDSLFINYHLGRLRPTSSSFEIKNNLNIWISFFKLLYRDHFPKDWKSSTIQFLKKNPQSMWWLRTGLSHFSHYGLRVLIIFWNSYSQLYWHCRWSIIFYAGFLGPFPIYQGLYTYVYILLNSQEIKRFKKKTEKNTNKNFEKWAYVINIGCYLEIVLLDILLGNLLIIIALYILKHPRLFFIWCEQTILWQGKWTYSWFFDSQINLAFFVRFSFLLCRMIEFILYGILLSEVMHKVPALISGGFVHSNILPPGNTKLFPHIYMW